MKLTPKHFISSEVGIHLGLILFLKTIFLSWKRKCWLFHLRVRVFPNLPLEEREAFRILKSDRSIVIKEADKGSAVVVWDKVDYVAEADR